MTFISLHLILILENLDICFNMKTTTLYIFEGMKLNSIG